MSSNPPKTRFAPSPTGLLHFGNVRTALFNLLFARSVQGRFLLRIEDTDKERSRTAHTAALQTDLRWLGLAWDEGPGRDGPVGPYLQSERAPIYDEYFSKLEAQGDAYPCFCSEQELSLSRKARMAAGKPPRYSGRCRSLREEEVAAKRAEGLKPTLRFRVAREQVIEFDDLVRGGQRFTTDEIGDFIIRRSDGTPAFFFSNAVDDALMGVTHVLRGEDHLTNTPRQMLLMHALGLDVPRYAHIALIVGADGAPLSKRHGSFTIAGLRAQGYLPAAIVNYLARVGHTYEDNTLLDLAQLAADFDLGHLGRAPARYDEAQLLHWQQLAVQASADDDLWSWFGDDAVNLVPDSEREAFIAAARPNIVFPGDALHWANIVYTDNWELDEALIDVVRQAGSEFFIYAIGALEESGADLQALVKRLKEQSGARGRSLFMPLRAALTGELEGPELAALLPLIGRRRALKRFEDAVKVVGT